eukprot:4935100-Pyramimonas_sp.AAC.1
MGSRLDGHLWRRRCRHESLVRVHGLITAAHTREAMKLIRSLANKSVADPLELVLAPGPGPCSDEH